MRFGFSYFQYVYFVLNPNLIAFRVAKNKVFFSNFPGFWWRVPSWIGEAYPIDCGLEERGHRFLKRLLFGGEDELRLDLAR